MVSEQRLRELWLDSSLTLEQVASKVGMNCWALRRVASRLRLPKRTRGVPTHGVSREDFTAAWMDYSLTKSEVAFKLKIPKETCRTLAAHYGLPLERDGYRANNVTTDPTPEEIAERCEMIRSRWTEEDWAIRDGRRTPELAAFSFNGADCSFTRRSLD